MGRTHEHNRKKISMRYLNYLNTLTRLNRSGVVEQVSTSVG